MMEGDTQGKYILLNHDSDLEEVDQSQVSSMRQTQKGGRRKLFTRNHTTKKFSPDDQPQRVCYGFFGLLIFTFQLFLIFFILKLHQDLGTLKEKEASTQIKASLNIASEQTDVETINSRKEQTENELKGLNQQRLQYPVGSKEIEFGKRLENVTTTLNNLQKHVEEDLEDVFLQLSQLKENLSVLETTLNISRMEYFDSSVAAVQSFQGKGKGAFTPGLTPVPSSHDDEVSAPEQASADPAEAADSGISENKPTIVVSFLKNLTDLQVFFYGADSNADGYLTYGEIQRLLREETPEQEQLELFDHDKNKMFSYRELIRAFGLTE